MEQEKIEIEKQNLEEIKEKFEKCVKDDEEAQKDLVKNVRNKISEKKMLAKKIEDLNNLCSAKDTQIKKYEDDLVDFREHKHFLDVLAIQAGKKAYNPKKPEEAEQTAPDSPSKLSKGGGIKTANTIKDNVFMTGLERSPNKNKSGSIANKHGTTK